jgi:hypothetical protein
VESYKINDPPQPHYPADPIALSSIDRQLQHRPRHSDSMENEQEGKEALRCQRDHERQ